MALYFYAPIIAKVVVTGRKVNMSAGISTINTVLKAGTTAATLAKLCKIKTYPQIGGEPEQIETTDLEDVMQTFVPGVQQVESMQFTANFDKVTYTAISASAGTEQFYQLEFGEAGADGIFSWQGQHSVFVNEGEVNGAREMTITVTPSTVISPEAASDD